MQCQACCTYLWSQQPSRACWKSTTGSWNPLGLQGGSAFTTLKRIVCHLGKPHSPLVVHHPDVSANKIKRMWSKTDQEPVALVTVSGADPPVPCSSCLILGVRWAVLLAHLAKGIVSLSASSRVATSVYCTSSCQRGFRQDSAKENAEHVLRSCWNIFKYSLEKITLAPTMFVNPVWAWRKFLRFGEWWPKGREFLFHPLRAWPLIRAPEHAGALGSLSCFASAS